MNRGLHDLASSIKRKVAAVFAPVEPKPHRSGLLRRTLLVTAMGLFAGAAALGMVQQPDRSEIPPTRVIQSILPLTTDQVEVSTPSAAPYISETRIRAGDTLAAVLQRLELDSRICRPSSPTTPARAASTSCTRVVRCRPRPTRKAT